MSLFIAALLTALSHRISQGAHPIYHQMSTQKNVPYTRSGVVFGHNE